MKYCEELPGVDRYQLNNYEPITLRPEAAQVASLRNWMANEIN